LINTKVVSLGGGHGLAAALRALRKVTTNITAIVTVADNGGSSGRLREEFNSLPPGDLRMALAALCSDDEWGRGWAEILQYRFTSQGALDNHALGNLLLTALWDRDGDPVQGIDRVGELLKVIGRVLPMATTALDIEGTFRTWEGSHVIRGQKEVATGRGTLENLRLIPEDARTTPDALRAISDADWITLGPGSWYSSVMPHLLMNEQREAIYRSKAQKLLVLNLDAAPHMHGDELAGSSPTQHLQVLFSYAPEFQIDVALVDLSTVSTPETRSELESLVQAHGGRLIVADLAENPGSIHHDSEKLADSFRNIFTTEMIR
jgi:uncharacterized cofD-like protein